MPGAAVLVDQLDDATVLEDEVVRRDAGRGRGEPGERALRRGHAGVVEEEDVDAPAAGPRTVVRRGALFDRERG